MAAAAAAAAFTKQLLVSLEALHAESASQSDRADANASLIALSQRPDASNICAALLDSAAAEMLPEPALLVAAGIVSEAALVDGISAAVPLLRLCARVPSRGAALRLAEAAASLVPLGHVHEMLCSEVFGAFDTSRQLLLLQALGRHLESQGSAEELVARPSVVSACDQALSILWLRLSQLPWDGFADDASDSECIMLLQCLVCWFACGVSYSKLKQRHPALLQRLLSLLLLPPEALKAASASDGGSTPVGPCTSDGRGRRSKLGPVRRAALAASALRTSLQVSLEADGEFEMSTCLELLGALAHLRELDPSVDPDGELPTALAGTAGLALELVVDSLPDGQPPNDTNGSATASLQQLSGVVDLLLASSTHPVQAPAELAAEGWMNFALALPASWHALRTGGWCCDLLASVVGATCSRSSRSQVERGVVTDWEDVCEFRDRCAAPLFAACSEKLQEHWFLLLDHEMERCIDEGTAVLPEAHTTSLNALEVALFAVSCTSHRTIWKSPHHGVETSSSCLSAHRLLSRIESARTISLAWCNDFRNHIPHKARLYEELLQRAFAADEHLRRCIAPPSARLE